MLDAESLPFDRDGAISIMLPNKQKLSRNLGQSMTNNIEIKC